MAKEYWLKFGTGNPADTAGLSPTFTLFASWTGGLVSPPGITAPFPSLGLFRFEYTPSYPIVFVADGATTGLSSANRYLTGSLDPLDLLDERIAEVGSTLIAVGSTLSSIGLTLIPSIGNSLFGFGASSVALGTSNLFLIGQMITTQGGTASSFGTTSVDPGTVMGYLKRLQELQEGDASFNKTTGVWSIQTRGGTLLQEKTVTNGANTVTKT